MPKVKMGRPTDNPKKKELTVRFDNEMYSFLESYAKDNDITRTEVVRLAVRRFMENKK